MTAAWLLCAGAWLGLGVLFAFTWASRRVEAALAEIDLDDPIPYEPAEDFDRHVMDALRAANPVPDVSLVWSEIDNRQFWRCVERDGAA